MPTTASERTKLRDAIARVQIAEQQLAELREGQTRAHDQLRHAEDKLSSADGALQKVQNVERSRLAYAYVNNGELQDDPVAAAQANVSAAQAEVYQLEKIETALAGEIGRVQSNLTALHVTQYTVMAELVSNSNEYQNLIQQHREAWTRLRSCKEALRKVTAGLHGYLDQRLMDEAERSEPVTAPVPVGFAVDADFVASWQDAIAALESDADTDLPH